MKSIALTISRSESEGAIEPYRIEGENPAEARPESGPDRPFCCGHPCLQGEGRPQTRPDVACVSVVDSGAKTGAESAGSRINTGFSGGGQTAPTAVLQSSGEHVGARVKFVELRGGDQLIHPGAQDTTLHSLTLTDAQCNAFRRLPLSFNEMVITTFSAGAAKDMGLQQIDPST